MIRKDHTETTARYRQVKEYKTSLLFRERLYALSDRGEDGHPQIARENIPPAHDELHDHGL